MIIVVSSLLFWLAIFRSEDGTNDEYTKITWQLRVISITFDPYINSLPAQSIICSMTRIIGNMYHEYNPRKSFNFAKQAFCNTFIHYHGRIASIK